MRRRNRRYDAGLAAVHRVDAAVVSVGNLTLGGVGKTPMVLWLAQWLSARSVPLAIVSRGYGARGGTNDEARELAQRLPDVPHLQNPDRVAAAREAIRRHAVRMILLDDAFQHRRIARDLDIVLLDAFEPFGFGRVFPRGTLREPVEGLRRADIVALSRRDVLESRERAGLRAQVADIAPQAAWIELAHVPKTLVAASGKQAPLDSLDGRPVVGFCGLGNPAAFRRSLEQGSWRLVDFREFPDHHVYTPRDLDRLADWARGLGAEAVLCTRKDLVKLDGDRLGMAPLWAMSVDLEILEGRGVLETRLEALLRELAP